jgi:hypothetical protein
MRELFIYYRVRTEHRASLAEAVVGWHARLVQRHPYLKVRLLHRDQAPLDTWMEIFSTDPLLAPDGVDASLQATIEAEAAALTPWIEGDRHVEVFFACVS